MRSWYVALSENDQNKLVRIRKMMAEPYGYSLAQAAYYADVSLQYAQTLLARAKTTRAELKERRKDYIVKHMSDKTSVHRNSTHVIACYFMADEAYVIQLVKELRAEGRLPPAGDDSKDWQEDILKILRSRYPNVFRSETVGKQLKYPNMIYVAGKDWMTWDQAKALSEEVLAKKKSKVS